MLAAFRKNPLLSQVLDLEDSFSNAEGISQATAVSEGLEDPCPSEDLEELEDLIELEGGKESQSSETVNSSVVAITADYGAIRNSCLAHLLQLAVKDALSSSEYVTKMVDRTNSVVTFFHRSSHYNAKLLEETGGLGLVKPCVTRWNSQYHCMKRMLVAKEGRVSYTTGVTHPTRGWERLERSLTICNFLNIPEMHVDLREQDA